MGVRVQVIPCLRDNYAYMLVDEATREAVIIDPSEAAPIEEAIEAAGVRLTHLWATHHHLDHVGGAPELAATYGVSLLAHEVDAVQLRHLVPRLDVARARDRWCFHGAEVELLHVPGHTLGAATFVCRQDGAVPWLFTGDTLFLGGCGRVFEGTAAMLRASLEAIASVAPEALVYCGHEYTAANLQFARTVEPANVVIAEALERARTSSCTMPGRLTTERLVNPFLRPGEAAERLYVEALGVALRNDDDVFAALRLAKNTFRLP